MRLIDLFEEMDKKHTKLKELIENEYFRIKEQLNRVPTRMDLFSYMDDSIYQQAIKNSKENPFKRYLEYRKDLNELSLEEEQLYQGIGKDFIIELENTRMTKVYKMPVLMAFYNHGHIRMELTEDELLKSWKEFFSTGSNWKDFFSSDSSDITYKRYQVISDKEHINKIKDMPVKFLLKSSKSFFIKKDGSVIALKDDLKDVINNPVFIKEISDVIEYRVMDYYQRRYREKEI